MNYYNKYKKYIDKLSTLNKKDNEVNNTKYLHSGGRYKCVPENKFIDICIEEKEGKYKSKDGCINECENEYIKNQLIKGNLHQETAKFYNFIKEIIRDEKIDVYIKGGNVIGLKLLKMIYDEYKDDEQKFKKYFNEFLKLGLMKDWDFSSYTKKEITKEYRKELDKLAKKHHLFSHASTFILYQAKKPIMTDEDNALFEISILENDNAKYSNMEIPLTTMKVKIDQFNVKYVFMFAKTFLDHKKGEEFDFDLLKRLISKISVIIHSSKNGFYNDPKNFDKGKINDELINYLKVYKKYDENLPQFLVTQLQDPWRLLYRLPEKNIHKTQKILSFLNNTFPNKTNVDWLLDPLFVSEIVEKFTKDFGDQLENIYKYEEMDGVMKFMDGIRWNRVDIDYDKLLTDKGKNLLKNMLNKLAKTLGKDKINELNNDNKFNKLLKKII
jgi:hypothetical protein